MIKTLEGQAYNASYDDHDNCSMPPELFMNKVNLDPYYAVHLAMENDEGTSFSEIADMIERDI